MPPRIIAIGDIHGCSKALDAVLAVAQPDKDDIVVGLGDYVDRGPDSRGTLDRLIALGKQCQLKAILGNHDQMLLQVIRGELEPSLWLACGGVATLESYGFEGDFGVVPAEHVEFLEQCIDYYETETHFFVHANYDAGVPLDEQSDYALRWRKLNEETPRQHFSGRVAVVGHTPNPDGEVVDLGHLHCIDTYCYGGGWLTALEITSGKIWQADKDGVLRNND